MGGCACVRLQYACKCSDTYGLTDGAGGRTCKILNQPPTDIKLVQGMARLHGCSQCLGKWGTHACPQCLPTDTVPIRSRTWTLRPPAVLHRLLPYHGCCYRRHNRMRPVFGTSFICTFEVSCMIILWWALLTALWVLGLGLHAAVGDVLSRSLPVYHIP